MLYQLADRYSGGMDNRHPMNQLAVTFAFCAMPAVLGLLGIPIAARLLAGAVKPGRWLLVVLGWAVGSTLAFAAWFRHATNQEIAEHRVGPMQQDGVFMILGFVFWNGMLILAINLGACIVGAVLRRRRRAA